MKLYASTTSERATKGQGGNKFLRTVFTARMADGTDKELFHVYLEPADNGYLIDIATHHGDTIYRETYEDDSIKGKQETGEDGRG